MVLSANTQDSLRKQVNNAQEYLAVNRDRASDVSYTLSRRREHLIHRSFFIVGEENVTDASLFTKVSATTVPITMIFSGQGAQWPEMGRELAETDPEFRKDIQAMDEILKSLKHPPGWTIESKHCSISNLKWFLTPRRRITKVCQDKSDKQGRICPTFVYRNSNCTCQCLCSTWRITKCRYRSFKW